MFHDRTGTVTRTVDGELSPRCISVARRAVGSATRLEGPRRPKPSRSCIQDYYDDGSGKAPRYYQVNAINRTVEAIAKGQNRILLVMATGTGKTYTAFQIIWRLWKAGRKKRILFLADRNILVDQTMANDFSPFGAGDSTKDRRRRARVDKAVSKIYLVPLPGHHRHRGTAETSTAVLARTSSTSSSSTSATAAAPPRMRPGARSSNISRPPRRSA